MEALTVQDPNEHKETIGELMQSVSDTIQSKDTLIAEQRKQLIEVRDMLKAVLLGSYRSKVHAK